MYDLSHQAYQSVFGGAAPKDHPELILSCRCSSFLKIYPEKSIELVCQLRNIDPRIWYDVILMCIDA